MTKLIASALLVASFSAGQSAPARAGAPKDATAILANARTAFLENRQRERFWTWTTISDRSITDKAGTVLKKLPQVTIESPIRSDGKRCNAVLAWGDGVEPYLANASADERCKVEKESPETFTIAAFLESRQVKLQSSSATAITLAIREDKQAMESTDPVTRCVASVRGTIRVDPATFFPMHIEVTTPGDRCILRRLDVPNHYDDEVLKNVVGGATKGTFVRYDYELQTDKNGNASKNFWICTHLYSLRPMQKNATAMLISGRRFPTPGAGDRRVILETRTKASELSAESLIKFEPEKPL